MVLAGEPEVVLVLAILEPRLLVFENRLKDNLRRGTAEIEDGIRGVLGRRADGVEKVVGGDPRVDALVPPVHDHHSVLVNELERVLLHYPLLDRL